MRYRCRHSVLGVCQGCQVAADVQERNRDAWYLMRRGMARMLIALWRERA